MNKHFCFQNPAPFSLIPYYQLGKLQQFLVAFSRYNCLKSIQHHGKYNINYKHKKKKPKDRHNIKTTTTEYGKKHTTRIELFSRNVFYEYIA